MPRIIKERFIYILVENAVPVVTVNNEGAYTVTYSNLPEKESGSVISYVVKEDTIDGYSVSPKNGEAVNHGTLENIHTPETIEISGTKTWDDNNNQDGARPDSITVRLKADGDEKDRQIVTSENGWKYSFTGLPKYANGKEIVYTISEDAVVGYTSLIKGDVHSGFSVTNKVITIKVSKVDATTKKEVAGATIQILDESGKVVDEWRQARPTRSMKMEHRQATLTSMMSQSPSIRTAR